MFTSLPYFHRLSTTSAMFIDNFFQRRRSYGSAFEMSEFGH
jgi:hypothetical protein